MLQYFICKQSSSSEPGAGVYVLDAATITLNRVVSTGTVVPSRLALHPNKHVLCVVGTAPTGGGTIQPTPILLIDLDTDTVLQTLSVVSATGIVFAPDGSRLYVSTTAGVRVYDGATYAQIFSWTFYTGSLADAYSNLRYGSAVSDDGSNLFLCIGRTNPANSQFDGGLYRVDTATGNSLASVVLAKPYSYIGYRTGDLHLTGGVGGGSVPTPARLNATTLAARSEFVPSFSTGTLLRPGFDELLYPSRVYNRLTGSLLRTYASPTYDFKNFNVDLAGNVLFGTPGASGTLTTLFIVESCADGSLLGSISLGSVNSYPIIGDYVHASGGTTDDGGNGDNGGGDTDTHTDDTTDDNGDDDGGGDNTTPTGDLQGHVTNAADASPLPGVTVSLALPREAVTNGAGYYVFTHLPIGRYGVLFIKDGFVPQALSATTLPDTSVTLDAALQAAPPGAAYLVGFVVDGVTLRPVAGAAVTAGNGDAIALVETDENGAFILGVDEGCYLLRAAKVPYGDAAPPDPYCVGAGETLDVGVLALIPPNDPAARGVLFGYVSDYLTGSVLPGVAVSLVEHPEFLAVTDENGFYELDGPPAPENVTLYAFLTGYQAQRAGVRTLPSMSLRVDIGLIADGVSVGAVDGFVTDAADAAPVAGTVCRIPGLTQALANGRGYYMIEGVPAE